MGRSQHSVWVFVLGAVLVLAGCGGGQDAASEATPTVQEPAVTTEPTAEPTPDSAESLLDSINDFNNQAALPGVFATGFIESEQDADLVFQVNGQVGEVLVEEGDSVKDDELLAILDTRRLDQDVRNAEAALTSARADLLSLTEDPPEEQVRAAQAQVNQAVGNLTQVQGSVTQEDIAAARSTLEEARTALADLQDGADNLDIASVQARYDQAVSSLETQRTRLSQAKTQAEINLEQAAENLRQVQVDYSAAYWDWRYVRDHGSAPPRTENEPQPALSDHSEQSYRDRLNQAEIQLSQAEGNVESAEKALEEAQENEISGLQQAEAQVRDAGIALEQILEPAEADQLAAARARVANAEANLARLQGAQRAGQLEAAQAGVSSAQANLDQLFSDPTESQEMRAQANIERAQANLEQARLNREYAELRAPFAGEVAVINIDPGDPAPTGGSPAMRIVDMSDLRVEVDVTDADIDKVHIGQDAQVIADALPEQVFEGEVSFISPTADTNPQGVTTYRVRIDLVEENLPLRVGMSVSVNIDTDD